MAEHLSESFSRTVQEWERIKEQRVKRPPDAATSSSSALPATVKFRSRQSERRSKSSDRQPREKSRQRFEREITKREQKLEKERQKLERMKMRLENYDSNAEPLPLDFFKKLQEWDVIRNLKTDPQQPRDQQQLPGGQEHHARSRSQKHFRESISVPRERIMSDSASTTSAARAQHRKSMACGALSSGLSSGADDSALSTPALASPLVDHSTSIDLSVTMETIAL